VRVGIIGEPFWDGGLYSNTPIEAVFADRRRRSSLVFVVQF
jgi:NTE family protein